MQTLFSYPVHIFPTHPTHPIHHTHGIIVILILLVSPSYPVYLSCMGLGLAMEKQIASIRHADNSGFLGVNDSW